MAEAAAGTGLNTVPAVGGGGGGSAAAGTGLNIVPAAGGGGGGSAAGTGLDIVPAVGGGGGTLESLKLRKIELETELKTSRAQYESILRIQLDIKKLEYAKALISKMSAKKILATYKDLTNDTNDNNDNNNSDNDTLYNTIIAAHRLAIEFKTKENIEAELQTKTQELKQKEEIAKELVQKQETLDTELKKLELQIAKLKFASQHNEYLAKYPNLYGVNLALNDNDVAIELTSPFCDPVGFIQHSGECLTDSLIQIMLFCDGFKEITQPLFSRTTDDILRVIATKLGVEELPQSTKNFFTAIKRRFTNRYKLLTSYKTDNNKNYTSLADIKNLKNRRSELGVCIILPKPPVLPGPPNETRQMRRRASFTYARDIKGSGLLDGRRPNYELSNYWINQFIKIFSLPFMSIYEKQDYENNVKVMEKPLVLPSRPIACFCSGDYRIIHLHPRNKKLYFIDNNKAGHATCFYKCNGKLVYYDDNYGIFEIPNNLDIRKINAVIYKENHVEFANVYIVNTNIKSTAGNDIYVIEKITIIRDDGNKTFNNIQPIDYPFIILLMDNKNYIVNPSKGVPVVNSRSWGLLPWLKKTVKGQQNAGRRRKTRRR